MATLDPRIEEVRKKFGLQKDDFWELPQKKGTWVAKHAALELAAAKAKITFLAPQILEANGEAKSVAICVTGSLEDRSEWSVGEASPSNNRNAYPYAMAEKRGKDRVILKLIGLHGLAYSEDEADDFKQPAVSIGNGHEKPSAPEQDKDTTDGVANWVARQKIAITSCATLPALYGWLEQVASSGGTITDPDTSSPLDRLKRKAPEAYGEVVKAFNARLQEINRRANA